MSGVSTFSAASTSSAASSNASADDEMDWQGLEDKATTVQTLVTDAERESKRAQKSYEALELEVKSLVADYAEVTLIVLSSKRFELTGVTRNSPL